MNESIKDTIIKALRTVHDPEIPINIYDLGLIYDLEIDDEAVVRINMTLTAPNCPMAELIVHQVTQAARAVEGIASVEVELVWEPKWEPDMMSEAAKLEMEFTGHVGPAHLRKDKFSQLTVGKTRQSKKKP